MLGARNIQCADYMIILQSHINPHKTAHCKYCMFHLCEL